MPSLRDSAVILDPERWRPVGKPSLPVIQPAPALPTHLLQSTVMISSMPGVATTVDGITRQFYAPRGLPTRRLIIAQ